MAEKETGAKIIEGKTKIVFEDASNAELCIIESKDRITAGDGAKSHELEGKAEISTSTNHLLFTFLKKSGEFFRVWLTDGALITMGVFIFQYYG